jgi:fatty-acyl-CoA synthase
MPREIGADGDPSVAGLLEALAADDHPGLRFGDQVWSWRQVVSAGAVRASLLRSMGGAGPPHVGVLLGNVPEYLFWLGAAALAGAVVVGINPTRRGDELAGDILRTDCRLIVTDAEGAQLLDGLCFGVAADRVLRIDGAAYLHLLEQHQAADPHAIVADADPVPARRDGWPPSACAPRRRTASSGTTWPTAPCRCSTAMR